MRTGDACHLAPAGVLAALDMTAMPLRVFLLLQMTPKCRAAVTTYR
jgi:hypothetical protein